MDYSTRPWLPLVTGFAAILISFGAAAEQRDALSRHPRHQDRAFLFTAMVEKLPKAVAKNKMGVVAKASATLGAKKIGVTIPGNMVVMVFHPKFAVRMLEASVRRGHRSAVALLHHGKFGRNDDPHLS